MSVAEVCSTSTAAACRTSAAPDRLVRGLRLRRLRKIPPEFLSACKCALDPPFLRHQLQLEADAITGLCHRVTHVHVMLANAVLAGTLTAEDVCCFEVEGRSSRVCSSQLAGNGNSGLGGRTGNAMAFVLLSNVNAFLIKLEFPPLYDRAKVALRERVQRYRDKMLRRHDVAYLALQWLLRLPCRQGCHVAELPPEEPDVIQARETEHVQQVAARLRDEDAGLAATAAKRRADLDAGSKAQRGGSWLLGATCFVILISWR